MDVLTDLQTKHYDYLSRYATFEFGYNKNDSKYVYCLTNHLKTDTPFVTHRVQQYDTLDSISLHYYGRPDYYWIIADYNRINDPLEDISKMKSIKVPTLTTIEFEDDR